MSESLIHGRCDCGVVTISITKLPGTMNACPCEFCSRVGAHWGYFPHGSVLVEGKTDIYRRASRSLEFHRCTDCGVVTHWIDPEGRMPHMGANMRTFDAGTVSGVPVVIEP